MSELQKDLDRLQELEGELIDVEESASEQFRQWYSLNDERATVIKRLREKHLKEHEFAGTTCSLGPFTLTRTASSSDVDLSTLRRSAPGVLLLPGVVKAVDVKALQTLLDTGQLDSEQAATVRECIVEREPGLRINGPQPVKP